MGQTQGDTLQKLVNNTCKKTFKNFKKLQKLVETWKNLEKLGKKFKNLQKLVEFVETWNYLKNLGNLGETQKFFLKTWKKLQILEKLVKASCINL